MHDKILSETCKIDIFKNKSVQREKTQFNLVNHVLHKLKYTLRVFLWGGYHDTIFFSLIDFSLVNREVKESKLSTTKKKPKYYKPSPKKIVIYSF